MNNRRSDNIGDGQAECRHADKLILSPASIYDLLSSGAVQSEKLVDCEKYVRQSILRHTNLHSYDFGRKGYILNQYKRRILKAPPIHLCNIENAICLFDGIIIIGNRLIKETVQASVLRERRPYGPLRPISDDLWECSIDLGKLANVPSAVIAAKYGIESYPLIELLPRLWMAYDHLEDKVILLSSKYTKDEKRSAIWSTVDQLLDLFGIDANRVKAIPAEGVRVELLTYCTPPGFWGSMAPSIMELFGQIRSQLASAHPERRLYICTTDASEGRIANEDEVRATLQAYDFECIGSSTMDIVSQMEAFSDGRIICAPLGSALSNIVFSPPGTKIIPLIPVQWDDVFFYDIAALNQQEWYELRCEVRSNGAKLYHRNDKTVDIQQLRKVVDAALSDLHEDKCLDQRSQ